uniref:Uncharacterized protein n=1 Tax=Parascaris equorum TaxID=6256 RepID=A0A914S3J1_PAREQ
MRPETPEPPDAPRRGICERVGRRITPSGSSGTSNSAFSYFVYDDGTPTLRMPPRLQQKRTVARDVLAKKVDPIAALPLLGVDGGQISALTFTPRTMARDTRRCLFHPLNNPYYCLICCRGDYRLAEKCQKLWILIHLITTSF